MRSLVVKSSTLVYGCTARDPTWFGEDTPRTSSPRTGLERSLIEAEGYLRSFAEENRDIKVAVLRCANVLGEDLVTALSRALSLPLTPTIAGFDPQLQFVEQDDVVRAIEFAGRPQPGGGLQRGRRRPPAVVGGAGHRRPASAAAQPDPDRAWPRRRWPGSASCPCRPRRSTCSASVGASTTASSRAPGSSTATPPPGPSATSSRPSGCAGWSGETRADLPLPGRRGVLLPPFAGGRAAS